ncbi:uncharacterized protein VTP21DRAFT_10741 [Calcarisporiella thermophila]|uniref:uncharacterized protein n=1 Tax=Calcarisporiella thermophila TaxID=911321 RepID=UPI003743A7CF
MLDATPPNCSATPRRAAPERGESGWSSVALGSSNLKLGHMLLQISSRRDCVNRYGLDRVDYENLSFPWPRWGGCSGIRFPGRDALHPQLNLSNNGARCPAKPTVEGVGFEAVGKSTWLSPHPRSFALSFGKSYACSQGVYCLGDVLTFGWKKRAVVQLADDSASGILWLKSSCSWSMF